MLKRITLSLITCLLLLLVFSCAFLEATFSDHLFKPRSSSVSSGTSSTAPDQLMLWTKLDTAADVTNPQVGPQGSFLNPVFTSGEYGSAFLITNYQSNSAAFPSSCISPYQGTIECWFHLNNVANNQTMADSYPIAALEDGAVTYGIYLTLNDGKGGYGICGDAGMNGSFAYGKYSQLNTYAQILGDANAWHHIAVSWSSAGILGTNILVFLDGVIMPCGYYRAPQFIAISSGKKLKLGGFTSKLKKPLVIDNLKIWNFAKTNFGDRFQE